MKKKCYKFNLPFIVASLFLFLISPSLQAQYNIRIKIPITVVDNGGVSSTIHFGFAPEASYCIDPFPIGFSMCDSVIESERPPAPPDGNYDARFVASSGSTPSGECVGQGILLNIHPSRDPHQVDTFRLGFQPGAGGYPMTFRWPAGLAAFCDSMKFYKKTSAATANFKANMVSQTSVQITEDDEANSRATVIVYGLKGSVTATPPPSLNLPADGATGLGTSVTFSWTLASPPAGVVYRLQVSEDPSFSTMAYDDTTSQSSKQVSLLDQGTKYYWRVSSIDQFLQGCPQASPFNFITALGAPTLVNPSDGQSGVSVNATLRWYNIVHDALYEVQVSTAANFSSVLIDTTVTDTLVTVGPLQNCVTYYWKVKASTGNAVGNYSATRNFSIIDVPPGIPSLQNPPDSSLDLPGNPTFSWTGDVCSNAYTIQISKDPTFTITNVSQVVSNGSFQTPPLEGQTWYYWRVKATNKSSVSSSYSASRAFLTDTLKPLPPFLLPPQVNGHDVSLHWHMPINYPTGYSVKYATNRALSGATTENVTDSTLELMGLDKCSWYYWQVIASNGAGSSPGTPVDSFLTAREIPDPTVLSIPTDGQIEILEDQTFRWKVNKCANQYKLVIWDSTGSDVKFSYILSDTFKAVTLPDDPSTLYKWGVYAINEIDTGSANIFSFRTTALTTPKTPIKISPDSNFAGALQNPVLSWHLSKRTIRYRLQVAIDHNFDTLVVNDSTLTDTSKQIGPLLYARTYFWRVNATNSVGTSAYSPIWSFTTLFQPAKPLLIDPSNGSTGVSNSPLFQWDIPNGAQVYQLQVAKDADFTVIVYNDTTVPVSSWQVFGLDGRTWHYWRVRAKNQAGYGAWSSTSSFMTTIVGTASWAIPLVVSETGPGQDSIYFGMHPNATFGIDYRLSEYELPPASPGMFDVRFIDIPSRPNLLGEGLRVNMVPFRNYATVDTFRFSFQLGTGTYPVYFSWNPNFIRGICDSMVLMDEFNGLTLRERMDIVSSARLTNLSTKTLLIVKWGSYPVPTDVKDGSNKTVPQGFTLSQNYPNPFNPETKIEFSNEHISSVSVSVYDVLGQEVRTLFSGTIEPGYHSVWWNGQNGQGSVMPSGIYYVRMIATGLTESSETFVSSKKMLFIK